MRTLLTKRDNIVLLGLLVLGTVAYFTLQNPYGHRGGFADLDGYYYYIYLRSLQMDGDINFDNEYQHWGNRFKFSKTSTGYQGNIFGIGPALLWAPFFLLTHLLAIIGLKLGFPLSLDGMSRFHQVGTFYGSLVYGWMAVLLCYGIARRVVGKDHALWATLGAALAGPLACYCLNYSSYSHAQAAMASSLMVYLWLRWRGDWTARRWACFGAATGLLLLVRPACVPFVLLPVVEGLNQILPALREHRWSRAAIPLLGAGTTICVFFPQMLAWNILFGNWLTVPHGEGFMWWSSPAWASTLFSPRNGLLTSSPLMLAALIGLGGLAWKRHDMGLPLAGVFIGLLLVNGAVTDWWGWGFSSRRLTAALPIFTVGMAWAIQWIRNRLVTNPSRSLAWITALVVLAFILFNTQWLLMFSHRNLRWYSVRSTEGLYMSVVHGMLDRLYDRIGNPLSLPSSLAFSIRHGGDPRTYDRIDGSVLLGEFHSGANPAANPYEHATLNMGDLRFRYNLSNSFGNPKREADISYAPLRQRRGHVFLPLNRPGKLKMMILARALHEGTRVDLRFNQSKVASMEMPTRWSRLFLSVPAKLIQRGINRLDLIHHLPSGWNDPGPRCIGETDTCIPVDMAAISGGLAWGNFAEIWIAGSIVSDNVRGLNAAVLEPTSGKVLGTRAFDVFEYPAGFTELERYLGFFPRGSVVALAARGKVGRHFHHGGKRTLATMGASADLSKLGTSGYVALGVLGAAPGTALEQIADQGHARIRVGNPPLPWREIARYREIQLR